MAGLWSRPKGSDESTWGSYGFVYLRPIRITGGIDLLPTCSMLLQDTMPNRFRAS